MAGNVELTPHFQLILWVRMSGFVSPLPRMLHGVEKDFNFYEICGCHCCGYSDYGIPGVTPCNLADTHALEEPVASIIVFFYFTTLHRRRPQTVSTLILISECCSIDDSHDNILGKAIAALICGVTLRFWKCSLSLLFIFQEMQTANSRRT